MSALSEAVFMTGLERNAEVVYMASYAPLLAHLDPRSANVIILDYKKPK